MMAHSTGADIMPRRGPRADGRRGRSLAAGAKRGGGGGGRGFPGGQSGARGLPETGNVHCGSVEGGAFQDGAQNPGRGSHTGMLDEDRRRGRCGVHARDPWPGWPG